MMTDILTKTHKLALMLSEKRNLFFRRAYNVNRRANFDDATLALGAVSSGAALRVSSVFANQDEQWPQMGKALIVTFPVARAMLMTRHCRRCKRRRSDR